MRMLPAFEGCDIACVTTQESYRSQVTELGGRGEVGVGGRFYVVRDANRWNKVGLVRMALSVFFTLLRERPSVVISTGAAPGYFALRFGRWLGARTIWVDSIANVEELSLSGRKIGKYADLWLTQWPHLARPEGPQYVGAVL